jgi:beta-barrel assembly-enhancing protease
MKTRARFIAVALVVALLGPGSSALSIAQDRAGGFNLFTVQQDIEIGQRSAQEAERQLPMSRDRRAERFLNQVVAQLADSAPGHNYPYQVRLVDASDINAFALPGGYLYVNRGLLQAVRSEAELAGVLGHEMAHVALRHGTQQASKAYAAKAGLGLVGRLLGREGERDRQVVEAVGGFGLNTVFLKFGRDAEHQADRVGTRMMAEAGYDARELASFFELLQNQRRRNPSAVENFLSSHPSPADRVQRVSAEAAGYRGGRRAIVGGFEEVQAGLRRQPPARSLAQRSGRGQD